MAASRIRMTCHYIPPSWAWVLRFPQTSRKSQAAHHLSNGLREFHLSKAHTQALSLPLRSMRVDPELPFVAGLRALQAFGLTKSACPSKVGHVPRRFPRRQVLGGHKGNIGMDACFFVGG